MTHEAAWDPEVFEKEWIEVSENVVNQLLADKEIQQIKIRVRDKGSISIEDREQFIDLVNKIKYDVIYKVYGDENSEGYLTFQKAWQHWMKLRATSMPKAANMFEENIYHLMYGSTPDPEAFLKDFDVNND
jgi:hypothetical protein